MIAAGVGLALLAAVVHATWNVILKVSGDPLRTFRRATVMSAIVATVVLVPEVAILGRPHVSGAALGLVFISSLLETAYLILLAIAYRRGELSGVYPIARGSAPLWSVAVGLLLLGERLSAAQLIGVALLLAGIAAVAFSQAHGRATAPALLTGVSIAAFQSVDRLGVRLMEPWFYGWLLFVLMAVELQIVLAVGKRLAGTAGERDLPSWGRSTLIGGGMWLGYFLVLLALSLAPLTVVAPVREVAIVAVAAWGVWRMREGRSAALKLSGAAAALVGVALLAV